MNHFIKTIRTLPLVLLIILPMAAFAGGGAPPGTPIDGGLGLLLLAGGAYGMKKLTGRKK